MPAASVALARPRNLRLVRVITLFAAVLTAAALLMVAGPASAHDQFISSDPQDGATLPEPPTSISMTFSAEPLDTGMEIAVVGPDDATVQGADIQVRDKVVTTQLPDGLAAGSYHVAWHVVSSDGHPIEGEFSYMVKSVSESTEEPPTGAEESTGLAEAAEATQEPDSASEAQTAKDLAELGKRIGPGDIAVIGGIIAAVLVVLGVVAMVRRKILENKQE